MLNIGLQFFAHKITTNQRQFFCQISICNRVHAFQQI